MNVGTTQSQGGTFLGGSGVEVRSDTGYGGMLNDIEEYISLQEQLEDVKKQIADHEWETEVDANKLYNKRIELLDAITQKETNLLNTRNQLVEYRSYLAGSMDELSIELIAQLNSAIEELDESIGKTPKTFDDFKDDLNGLSSKVLKKFLSGLDLTQDELKDFKKWLDNCGYSADKAADFFSQYVNELNAPKDAGSSLTAQRIGELTSLQDELAKTTSAIEAYNSAMEGGEKGDIVSDIAEIYKGAMEDIKSGRIDSNRVNALAELLFSPEQLAAWGFDIERVGKEMQSEMLRAMFDPAGDSTKSYGQRFAEYIRSTFGASGDIGVKDLGNGRFEFYYDNIEHLARAVGMSEEVVAAFLDDLDAYGVEVMRSTDENKELIAGLQELKKELGSGTSMSTVAEEFAKQLAEGGRNAFQIGRILEDMRKEGYLNVSDEDIVNAVKAAKKAIEEEAQNNNDLIDIDSAKIDLQDLRKFFEELFKEPVEAKVVGVVENQEGVESGATENITEDFSKIAEIQIDDQQIRDLYTLFGDLANETGSTKTAIQGIVDILRQSGMDDSGITAILDAFSSMGSAFIPSLKEIDAAASNTYNTLTDLGNLDVEPDISADTSPAYRKIQSLINSLNSLSKSTWTVRINAQTNTATNASTNTSSNNKADNVKAFGARAAGGVTGKAGPTLVNELGPELISDKGRAFIANSGKPGFVNLSKDAIVFTAAETKEISRQSGRKGLIGRLLGRGTGSAATGKWKCNICGYANNLQTDIKCRNCGSVRGATKTSTTSSKQKANQQAKIAYTSTTSGKLGATTAGKTATTTASSWWYCSNCGHANPSSSSRCEYCGASKNGSLISKGLSTGATKTIKTALGNKTVFQAGQGYGLEDLFTGDDGSAGGGGNVGGGADSQSKSNPQKIDWIAVRLNRIQRAVQDLEKIASSGLKKLSTRLDATRQEASKLNDLIDNNQRGYNRYMQEAESVGLREDLAAKVRYGTIDIEEFEDEELRQQIQEYQEWYEKALDCASAVEDLNQQIGELYKTNFDLVQADYANKLGLIEHEMNMINADVSMAQAKGMLDSAEFYERLSEQQVRNIAMMHAELTDLEYSLQEAMASGKIEEGSETWYEMVNAINETKEAIANANVQLQEYQKTVREIKWNYFDYAQERFSQLAQEANFLIGLMSNDKLFQDNGQFNDTGLATLGMRAVNYDAYMAQADEYAKEMHRIEQEMANDPYNKDLIARRATLLGLQQQSIQAAESEKDAVKSLVQEGIQLELESMKKLIDAYKDSLDSAKDLYEYQKKVSEKTADIASIQKQLAAYQGDTSEETRAKVQKLNKDLEKARTDLYETERDQSISDQKKLLDDVYNEYEELLNARLDDVDALMREMIETANANSGTIREEIASVADKVGYIVSGELSDAMSSYANYNYAFEGMTGVTTVLNDIYNNVNAMARAAGAVKAYAKGGLIDYTGLAAVHGSPGKPEMVLSADDTQRFLEAAQMMRSLITAPATAQSVGSVGTSGDGGIGQVTLGPIMIDHVQDYNDFVRQLQADPKFEKLIDTLTMNRMLGGSKLAKNNIRF